MSEHMEPVAVRSVAPVYVNDQGAATILGFSVATVRKMRADKTGPKFLVTPTGKNIRYRVADLLAWMESGTEGGEVHYAEQARDRAAKRKGAK